LSRFKLTINRGDSRSFLITVTSGGSPYSLTGKTVWFTGKLADTDTDAQAIIAKKTGGQGITILAAPNDHQARVAINPADTSALTREVILKCDVQVKDGSGNVYTVSEGLITVEVDITRAIV